MLATSNVTTHYTTPPTNSSPTPSIDSLNGMAVSMLNAAASAGPIGAPPMTVAQNVDQLSDSGSHHSEPSSGLGSLVANVASVGGPSAAIIASGNQLQQSAVGDRSASTSSAGSLSSSGLGSSPLGGATLPLFGNGAGTTNGNAPAIVNGHGPNLSPQLDSGLSASASATPPVSAAAVSAGSPSGILPKCSLCCAPFTRPKVLHECFHIFCQSCLEKVQDHPDKITCPSCRCETSLSHGGVSGLLSDTGMVNLMRNNSASGAGSIKDFQSKSPNFIQCTVCSGRDAAVAKCITCHSNLCTHCASSHLYANRFENNSHLVCTIGEYVKKHDSGCIVEMRDLSELNHLIADGKLKVSDASDKKKALESSVISLQDYYKKVATDVNDTFQYFINLLEERKTEMLRELDNVVGTRRLLLNACNQKHQESIDKVCQMTEFTERLFRNTCTTESMVFKQFVEQRLQTTLKSAAETGVPSIEVLRDFAFVPNYHVAQNMTKSLGMISSRHDAEVARMISTATSAAISSGPAIKQPPISRPSGSKLKDMNGSGLVLSHIMNGGGSNGSGEHSHHHSGGSSSSCGSGAVGSNAISNGLVQGIANLQASSHPHSSSSVVNGTIGDMHHPNVSVSTTSTASSLLANGINGLHLNGTDSGLNGNNANAGMNRMLQMEQQRQHYSASPLQNGFNGGAAAATTPQLGFDPLLLSKRMNGATLNSIMSGVGEYDRWSNGANANDNMKMHQQQQHMYNDDNLAAAVASYKALNGGSTANGGAVHDSMLDLPMLQQLQQSASGTSSSGGAMGYSAPKSQIKRQKMIYHCKFGEFGVLEGQFTEPSGVAVNAQNDIIVADTNNHRIQIFDKDGRFKFQFGECGKRDGQLLYPNRVAAVRSSGDIIVTERSPTHQVQIYNQYGQFVRKFGANILQHPRGVCVDNKGRIIVVECKVMRVIIFDQMGNVLNKFGCSKHLEFPNGVVVNDRQEIFISDNRAHCVKVFNYEGQYVRQIGGEGLTNYPIGVGINAAGEVTIADNHNNFNLSIFSQDGKLLSALESKVKHAQCFDVALMDDGSVVLASKDYRLYIYRYVQLPPIGM